MEKDNAESFIDGFMRCREITNREMEHEVETNRSAFWDSVADGYIWGLEQMSGRSLSGHADLQEELGNMYQTLGSINRRKSSAQTQEPSNPLLDQ